MSKKLLLGGFCFQLLVLGGMWVTALYPHWVGQEILLRCRPYDPRNLFMGNYARLNPEISRLSMDLAKPDTKNQKIRAGEVIYVTLKLVDNVWEAESFSLNQPEQGTYIKGRASNSTIWSTGLSSVEVQYGIEEFYASPEVAQSIENDARRAGGSGLIRVKLAPNGMAGLVGFEMGQASS